MDVDKVQGKQFGSYFGPNSKYVKLISSDGHEFFVKRKYAILSGTIKNMLNGPGEYAENEPNEINLSRISSSVLATVIKYLTFKAHHVGNDFPDISVPPEFSLDLLLAADFLEC